MQQNLRTAESTQIGTSPSASFAATTRNAISSGRAAEASLRRSSMSDRSYVSRSTRVVTRNRFSASIAPGTHSQLGNLSTGPVSYHVDVLSNASPPPPAPSATAAATSPAAPGSSATVTPSSQSGGPAGSSSGNPPADQTSQGSLVPPRTGDAGLAATSDEATRADYLVALAGVLGRRRDLVRPAPSRPDLGNRQAASPMTPRRRGVMGF
jgi:hypothetical protein